MSRAANPVNRECGIETVIGVGSGELLGHVSSLINLASQWRRSRTPSTMLVPMLNPKRIHRKATTAVMLHSIIITARSAESSGSRNFLMSSRQRGSISMHHQIPSAKITAWTSSPGVRNISGLTTKAEPRRQPCQPRRRTHGANRRRLRRIVRLRPHFHIISAVRKIPT